MTMASVAVGSNKEKGVPRTAGRSVVRYAGFTIPVCLTRVDQQQGKQQAHHARSWLMSQSEYARAGFIRLLGRPMDQNLPLCMWLFSSPSISGSSCHSGLEVWDIVVSESGLHTHGVSVPGARYSYKGRRTDIPPVIDMEPPQH